MKNMQWIFILLVLFPVETFAKLPAPELIVVQPMYGSPSGMRLKWNVVSDARDYEICQKVGLDICEETDKNWKSVGGRSTTVWFDSFETIPGTTYTYQVRAIGKNREKSAPSEPRWNTVKEIWPVTTASGPDGCTAAESLEVATGYNQLYFASEKGYVLHQGLDLSGPKGINSACVRAPMGGVISDITIRERKDEKTGRRFKDNNSVVMSFTLNGLILGLDFGHLETLNEHLNEGKSVETGTWLGNISPTFYDETGNKPENNHTHINFNFTTGVNMDRNPLEAWDNPQYRDPQGKRPEVEDSNGDQQPVRFRKGPNDTTYLSDDGKVYGPIDIVVEARDAQSTYEPWQAPLKVGYYIQRIEGEQKIDAVQSAAQPYVLIDSTNKFWGDLGMFWTTPERAKTLFDVDNDLRCKAQDHIRTHRLWFTYIVTNTTGIKGIPDDLDANQCWASDAKKTEASPNGYSSAYDDPKNRAKINQDAKFPDGKYKVRIRLEDYVHHVTNPEQEDYAKEVIVDNFLLYVERVSVTQAGNLIYDAGWELNDVAGQLEWVEYALSQQPALDVPLNVQVAICEPMQVQSVTLATAGQTIVLDEPVLSGLQAHSSTTQNTETPRLFSFAPPDATPTPEPTPVPTSAPASACPIWRGTVTLTQNQEEYPLIIKGQDVAGNNLPPFADTTPKAIPTHPADGNWPAPSDAGDTVHRLRRDIPTPTPTATPLPMSTPIDTPLCTYQGIPVKALPDDIPIELNGYPTALSILRLIKPMCDYCWWLYTMIYDSPSFPIYTYTYQKTKHAIRVQLLPDYGIRQSCSSTTTSINLGSAAG